jgi:predicted transcriptional regulator
MRSMTELLERAVETMRGLPAETQDALARILLELAGEDPSLLQLSPDDEKSLRASLLEAERGEFATDEEIRAIWAKHGL